MDVYNEQINCLAMRLYKRLLTNRLPGKAAEGLCLANS